MYFDLSAGRRDDFVIIIIIEVIVKNRVDEQHLVIIIDKVRLELEYFVTRYVLRKTIVMELSNHSNHYDMWQWRLCNTDWNLLQRFQIVVSYISFAFNG